MTEKCPFCSKPLSGNGDLLECPAGHYRAPMRKYNMRWERFYQEAEGVLLSSDRGIDLATDLLFDLQGMNIRRIEI